MPTAEDNERLTRAAAGTPMGDTFRRNWIPALLGEEVAAPDGPPVRVRLLGEDLIAFRDSAGQVEECNWLRAFEGGVDSSHATIKKNDYLIDRQVPKTKTFIGIKGVQVSSRRAACLAAVVLLLCTLPATAQVRQTDDGKLTVVPYGGTSAFSDPPRYGIYCASAPLLEAADPYRRYPAWQASAAFRNLMEAWRENPHVPRGRGPNDFVLYLNVGTTFHVRAAPEPGAQQNPHYQITIDSGPSKGQTCWTNYD